MGYRGPGPAQGGRKPEPLDAGIGLVPLSPPPGEDSGAGQDLGLLGGAGGVLVTGQGLRLGRRALELLDAEEAAPAHPQPAASAPARVHHRRHGNAPGPGPLQPLTGDPGPGRPWSAGGGPGLGPPQSAGGGHGPGPLSLAEDLGLERPQ